MSEKVAVKRYDVKPLGMDHQATQYGGWKTSGTTDALPSFSSCRRGWPIFFNMTVEGLSQ